MSSNIPKGGRGHLAPYEQAMCRVPEPIKEGVQKVVNEYRAAAQAKDWEKGDRIAKALENFDPDREEQDDRTEYQMLELLLYRWKAAAEAAPRTSRDWVQLRRLLADWQDWKNQLVYGELQEMTGNVAGGDAGRDRAD